MDTVKDSKKNFFEILESIDRRILYIFIAFSLSIPLVLNTRLRPAPMKTADSFFKSVEALEPTPGKIVLIAADWGPGTMAENKPQTMLAIEHLMRKRIPFALLSIYTLASPFLDELPLEVAAALEKEMPGEQWVYGKDWVNLGYRPGGGLMIQALATSKDLHQELKEDANAIPISEIPMMKGITSIKDISMLMEFTGLVGAFNVWLQYFQGPEMVHGCTSITIPEAFLFYSSEQISGLFEGVAGAAWYEVLLNEKYESRDFEGLALAINTGLSYAQILILVFIVLGNMGLLTKVLKREK